MIALQLPVAVDSDWFRVRAVTDTLYCIDEPFVHELLRANIWWLRGNDRDLVVDTGVGVASLRAHVPELFARDPVTVLTHAHLDHMGGAHEFDVCHAHPGEPFTSPPSGSLLMDPLLEELGISGEEYGLESGPLLEALPSDDYEIGDYRLRPANAITPVHEGSRIDIGDRVFTVLHLPGHTPAGVALYDERNGALFSGDVAYDDILISDCIGADVGHYRMSMRRLLDLEVSTVYPGHGQEFGKADLDRIASAYLTAE